MIYYNPGTRFHLIIYEEIIAARMIAFSCFERSLCLLALVSLMLAVDAQKTVVITVKTTIDATPTAPSPASYTSLDDFKDTVLKVSNDYRSSHDAKPLVWNNTLTTYARKWAETCIWKHSVRIHESLCTAG